MQTGKGILIPSILKVGNGTLKKIGQYLKAENLEQVVIFFGNGLRHGCHGFTETGRNHGIGVQRVGYGRYR